MTQDSVELRSQKRVAFGGGGCLKRSGEMKTKKRPLDSASGSFRLWKSEVMSGTRLCMLKSGWKAKESGLCIETPVWKHVAVKGKRKD